MTEELKSGLWYRCRDFVTEQSAGEWDDKTIADDADKLMAFVNAEGAATVNAHRENARLLGLVLHDLVGRVEAGKLAAINQCLQRSQDAIAKATGAE